MKDFELVLGLYPGILLRKLRQYDQSDYTDYVLYLPNRTLLNHLRRLNLKETEIALNKFAKKVVEDARRNLKVQDLYATGKLSKALGYKFKRSKNSYQFDFTPGYAAYVDKGVSGVKQLEIIPLQLQKKPPISAFDKWVLKRFPSETRDERGRFVDRRSMKFALQTHIYNYGIKQSLFFKT